MAAVSLLLVAVAFTVVVVAGQGCAAVSLVIRWITDPQRSTSKTSLKNRRTQSGNILRYMNRSHTSFPVRTQSNIILLAIWTGVKL